MTITQVLWGLISFLFIISFFFVRSWLIRIDKNIELKVDKDRCDERLKNVNGKADTLFKHKHAKENGEVIIP